VKPDILFRCSVPALAFVLLLAGCAVLQTHVEVPEMKLAGEMPGHARQVADALVMRLYDIEEKVVSARTGVSGSGAVAAETDFAYPGFKVQQVKFRDHISLAYEPDLHHVQGYIHMRDDAGRNACTSFAAKYTVQGASVTLVDGILLPVFSRYPEVELFIIPLDQLGGISGAVMESYGRTYKAVAAAALPLRKPGALPGGADDYAIFLFSKDRIAPGSTLEAWPSHTKERVDAKIVGDAASASYRQFDTGWTVGIIPATFSPGGDDELWVKAIMKEGGMGGGQTMRLVGLFSCRPMAAAAGTAGHPHSAVNQASLPEVRVMARQ
jgi:hypothetical protein